LRASQQRQPDVPAEDELLTAFRQFHAGSICLAVLRIEDLAAAPLVTVLPQVPQDLHADNALAVAVTWTLPAHTVRRICDDEQRANDARERSVDLANLYDGGRFTIDVADGVPESHRCGLSVCRSSQRERDKGQEGNRRHSRSAPLHDILVIAQPRSARLMEVHRAPSAGKQHAAQLRFRAKIA
jgi:hypothetical protein